MEGYLTKRGTGWKTWHKRFFTLKGSKVSWFTKQGADLKGELNIQGARVVRTNEQKKRGFEIVVFAPTRELHVVAESEREAEAWLAALTAAAGAGLATGSSASSSGADAVGGAGAAGKPDAAAIAAAIAVLPQTVEVDGTAEVGCELRVRLANSRLLDSLCVAWFRYTGAERPPPLSDVSTHAATKVISGATGPSYTVTELDLGHRIGCIVRPVSAAASRWSLLWSPVRSASASPATWVHVSLLPHEHHKYCDRRVRVCTAAGMHREGNVLAASVRGRARDAADGSSSSSSSSSGSSGYSGVPAGLKVVWYRSDVVEAGQLGADGIAASVADDAADCADMGLVLPDGCGYGRSREAASAAAAAGSGSTRRVGGAAAASPREPASGGSTARSDVDSIGTAVDGADDDDDDDPAPHAGTVVHNPRQSCIWRHLPGTVYRRIRPRPLEAMPVPPPDHAPSPAAPEIQRQVATLSALRSTLIAATAGTAGSGAAADGSGGSSSYPHSPFYPLCRDDVGRSICAVLLEEAAAEPDVIVPAASDAAAALGAEASFTHVGGAAIAGLAAVSLPAGPIDAAPPKARETWIEGPQTVGSLLLGRCYYFGGYEGRSVVSWIKITEDGDTVEIKPPAPCPPLPAEADAGGAEVLGEAHPRVLRLTDAERGCLIKFKMQPVRSDGDEGHGEASRPTAEIA